MSIEPTDSRYATISGLTVKRITVSTILAKTFLGDNFMDYLATTPGL